MSEHNRLDQWHALGYDGLGGCRCNPLPVDVACGVSAAPGALPCSGYIRHGKVPRGICDNQSLSHGLRMSRKEGAVDRILPRGIPGEAGGLLPRGVTGESTC